MKFREKIRVRYLMPAIEFLQTISEGAADEIQDKVERFSKGAMGKMKTYSIEETKDLVIGKKGTPRRDKYEEKLEASLSAYYFGSAVKTARQAQKLTQEQLGKKIGLQKSQISRIEHGGNITIVTLSRLFDALKLKTLQYDKQKGTFAFC